MVTIKVEKEANFCKYDNSLSEPYSTNCEFIIDSEATTIQCIEAFIQALKIEGYPEDNLKEILKILYEKY